MDALFELLVALLKPMVEFTQWIFPFKVAKLHDGELGVITTFGKVRDWRKSEVLPGIRFYYSFEDLIKVQAKGGFIDCAVGTVVTKDKKVVDINSSIIYNINDVKKSILETEDIELFLEGCCMDLIRLHALQVTQDELTDSEKLTQKLATKVNYEAKKYGVKVEAFKITTMSPYRASLVCDTIRDVAKSGVKIINDKQA